MRKRIIIALLIGVAILGAGSGYYWLALPKVEISKRAYDEFFDLRPDQEKITRQDIEDVFGPPHKVKLEDGREWLIWNSDEAQLVFWFKNGEFRGACPSEPELDTSVFGSVRRLIHPPAPYPTVRHHGSK